MKIKNYMKFLIKLPNYETKNVIEDTRDGKNMAKITLSDFKKDIK